MQQDIKYLVEKVNDNKLTFEQLVNYLRTVGHKYNKLPYHDIEKYKADPSWVSVDEALPDPEVCVEAIYLHGSMQSCLTYQPTFLHTTGRFYNTFDWVRVKFWRYADNYTPIPKTIEEEPCQEQQ